MGTRLIEEIGELNCYNVDKNSSFKFNKITKIKDIRDDLFGDFLHDQTKIIVLLAAEHHDDVRPTSLYYDVNVGGTKNVLNAMDEKKVNSIIFTSSVAVYGLNKKKPDENYLPDPFNHYGKSKWQAEEVL